MIHFKIVTSLVVSGINSGSKMIDFDKLRITKKVDFYTPVSVVTFKDQSSSVRLVIILSVDGSN